MPEIKSTGNLITERRRCAILENIFKGLLEWLFEMALEIAEYITNALLNVFKMDFAYFETAVPVSAEIISVIIAAGWALLIGNLVFQASKGMMSGLGFEGEDPKLLFMRTFVFSFLLLASRQICEIGLGIASRLIELLKIPSNVAISVPDESTFAMGGAKSTEDIFKGWVRMFSSMCLVMVLNVMFLKMLISAMTFMPTGLAVLPWMVLIVAIVKAARKIDELIGRIGLNPAITGGSMGRMLPGMLTYMVAKTATGRVAAAVAKSAGPKPSGGSFGAGTTSKLWGNKVAARNMGSGGQRAPGKQNAQASTQTQAEAYRHSGIPAEFNAQVAKHNNPEAPPRQGKAKHKLPFPRSQTQQGYRKQGEQIRGGTSRFRSELQHQNKQDFSGAEMPTPSSDRAGMPSPSKGERPAIPKTQQETRGNGNLKHSVSTERQGQAHPSAETPEFGATHAAHANATGNSTKRRHNHMAGTTKGKEALNANAGRPKPPSAQTEFSYTRNAGTVKGSPAIRASDTHGTVKTKIGTAAGKESTSGIAGTRPQISRVGSAKRILPEPGHLGTQNAGSAAKPHQIPSSSPRTNQNAHPALHKKKEKGGKHLDE